MENNTPEIQKEGEDFQSFSLYPGTSSVFVSNKLIQKIQPKLINGEECRIVQKYLLFDYFISASLNQYFYMSAPSEWEDVFELKYLDVLKNPSNENPPEILSKLREMSIFCTCMTYNDSDNEEASWKSYDADKQQIIRVSYDLNKLCIALDKATDEKLYIGIIEYKPRKKILLPTCVVNKRNDNQNDDNEVLFVNNFCLKQEAYNYEKELRFCKILYGEEAKKQKEYKIETIDVTNSILKITLPPINHKKIPIEDFNNERYEQIKKALLIKSLYPKISVHVSNLYDSSKEDMTSEITL